MNTILQYFYNNKLICLVYICFIVIFFKGESSFGNHMVVDFPMSPVQFIWHIVKTILQVTNHIRCVSLVQKTNPDDLVILRILL